MLALLVACSKEKRGESPAPEPQRVATPMPMAGDAAVLPDLQPGEPITILIGQHGIVVLAGGPAEIFNPLPDGSDDLPTLAKALGVLARSNGGVQVVIKADKAVAYGRVVAVIDTVKAQGFARFALATQ